MMIACPAFAFAAFLEPGQWQAFAAICVTTGLCLGADLALPPAIQADVADWDRLRFRRNRTAALFSLWNVSAKLALGLAALIVLPLLGAMGLEDTVAAPAAITALAVIYALPACVLKLTAVALMFRLPLTRDRQSLISTRLRRRDIPFDTG
jgi:Na+/melibiose symporter-like transporter